jgi:hypothetical protein
LQNFIRASQSPDWIKQINNNYFSLYSLSPTPPQTSITSLLESNETLSDDPSKKNQLCNLPTSRNSPSPTTTTALIDEVKKLSLHTSDPDIISKFKTSSPLASSSNLTQQQQQQNSTKSTSDVAERLCYNNNNNSESNRKWHCLVSLIIFLFKSCVRK